MSSAITNDTKNDTSPSHYVDGDVLRTRFAAAMSVMYRKEVPLYGDLIDIVFKVNASALSKRGTGDSASDTMAVLRASSERLTLERHGAIRLGTPYELKIVARLFGVLGMSPVGYYDLSIANLPMHATCFRPLKPSSLEKNPFRVFTTLLRPEVLSDKARKLALALLNQRNIFPDRLLELLDTAEARGGLTTSQADELLVEALQPFSWKPVAVATIDEYRVLLEEHPILADIASFQSAHINHLTPRTLDITRVQAFMREAGMAVKERIEGPPVRKCPILLRQVSFLALEESVKFRRDKTKANAANIAEVEVEVEAGLVDASHKARFGEIEQRGAAVTTKGRELYDKLLARGMAEIQATGAKGEVADAIFARVFQEYPDTWEELRRQGLIYFEYRSTSKSADKDVLQTMSLEAIIAGGYVEAVPITYEDFLPFSAAGIFRSNLQSNVSTDADKPACVESTSDPAGLEEAMGRKITDLDGWYADTERKSRQAVMKALGGVDDMDE